MTPQAYLSWLDQQTCLMSTEAHPCGQCVEDMVIAGELTAACEEHLAEMKAVADR